MSPAARRTLRRQGRFRVSRPRIKRNSRQPPSLVFFLSLIILIETLLILFLLPRKTTPAKRHEVVQKVEVREKSSSFLKERSSDTPALRRRAKTSVSVPSVAEEGKSDAPKQQRGSIAIVIDDWGYSAENFNLLSQIHAPLTIAILPFRVYSRSVAEFAHRHNLEVIIHMPMEPKGKERVDLEPRTVMTYMGNETIDKILKEAFDDVPYAKGINNHMGSLATEDEDFMVSVFQYLKKKNVYFLDSCVTADSVCLLLAPTMGIRSARRSVFLDNNSNESYIRRQIMELAKQSDKNGYAIGIGHAKEITLLVLKKEIPALEQKGYRFVFVSELVK